jgi:Pilus formation protein N terminal region
MADRWQVVLALALMVLSGATQAQEPATVSVLPQPTQTITMAMGQSTTVAVSRPFATIQIVDPNIVDAIAETNRRVTFVPKALGTTTVNILDENNMRVTSLLVSIDEIGIGRIKIHNQARLGSVTTYRCGVTAPATDDDRGFLVDEATGRRITRDETVDPTGPTLQRMGAVQYFHGAQAAPSPASTGCDIVKEDIMKAPAPVLTNNERREIIIRGTPPAGTSIAP